MLFRIGKCFCAQAGFVTCTQLLSKMKNRFQISTGAAKLDQMLLAINLYITRSPLWKNSLAVLFTRPYRLGGGMESCSITELFGEFRPSVSNANFWHTWYMQAEHRETRRTWLGLGTDWQVWKDTGLPLALGDGTATSKYGWCKRQGASLKAQKQMRGSIFIRLQWSKQCLEVVYIDTEGTFRPERIRQIAEGKGVSAEAGMRDPLQCPLS